MKQKPLFVAFTLLVIPIATEAQNQIVSWGDGAIGTDFVINQDQRTITLLRSNSNTYKFYAADPPGSPGTGVINNITIDDPNSMTGNFSLLIGDPNDPNDPNAPGALHWRVALLHAAVSRVAMSSAGALSVDDFRRSALGA